MKIYQWLFDVADIARLHDAPLLGLRCVLLGSPRDKDAETYDEGWPPLPSNSGGDILMQLPIDDAASFKIDAVIEDVFVPWTEQQGRFLISIEADRA